MASRSRVIDIAQAAAVSTATVDRVLHGRLRVRPVTAQRVIKAAAELNYLPEKDLWRTLQPAPMSLVFLLPAGTNRFLRHLGDLIRAAAPTLVPFNVQCRVALIDSFDAASVAAALRRHGRKAQGVAFMALEHPQVRAAVAALTERGVHVVTLISDLAQSDRKAYVGIDNRAAGRTAALLIGRFLAGRSGAVAMIAGSLSYRGHEEREAGFLQLIEQEFPALRVVGVREGLDDEQTNYRITRTLLLEHSNLVALYNIGGGAEGVGRALKAHASGRRPVFVAHGLTTETRALLSEGTLDVLINQDPQTMILDCVRIFTNLRDGRAATAGVEPVRINLVMRENLY